MIIKETIERECCDFRKDLKFSSVYSSKGKKLQFCVHCGQLWVWVRQMDPAGSMEDTLEKVEL
jgi:hypothetical protein